MSYAFLKSKLHAETHGVQVDMFSCIERGRKDELQLLQGNFLREGDNLHATLVLDHFLLIADDAAFDALETLLGYLEACRQYAASIRTLLEVPHTKQKVQKLLGFMSVSDGTEYEIYEHSVLHSYAMEHRLVRRQTKTGVVVHEIDMPRLIKVSLNSHLLRHSQHRIRKMWSASRIFLELPCHDHIFRGSCCRTDCQREHVDATKIDSNWFSLRVRLHYLQIMYLQAIDFVLDNDERRHWRGYITVLISIAFSC